MDRARELDLIETYLRTKGATPLQSRYAREFSSRPDKPKDEIFIKGKPYRFRSRKRRK
jgi:hypothetical protein